MFGGFRLTVFRHFYHQNPSKWGENDTLSHAQYPNVDLLLTEEEYVRKGSAQYFDFQRFGQEISRKFNHSVLLGIGLFNPNSFELWMANRTAMVKIFSYLKASPVPFVEDFERRQQKPTVADLSEHGFAGLSVSALICFDMLFPVDWVGQAHAATLVLNPSWLWNSFGNQFLDILRFRAIENGFNIFHCAQGGNAAAIDSFGQIVFKHLNVGNDELTIAQVSGPKNVHTIYSQYGGHFFDYICCAIGSFFILIAVILSCCCRKNEEKIKKYLQKMMKFRWCRKNIQGKEKMMNIELM